MRRVVQAIGRVGAEARYLPPNSPDLNPLEPAFSNFKKLLRDGAQRRSPLETLRTTARPLHRRLVPELHPARGVSLEITIERSSACPPTIRLLQFSPIIYTPYGNYVRHKAVRQAVAYIALQ